MLKTPVSRKPGRSRTTRVDQEPREICQTLKHAQQQQLVTTTLVDQEPRENQQKPPKLQKGQNQVDQEPRMVDQEPREVDQEPREVDQEPREVDHSHPKKRPFYTINSRKRKR